MLGRHVDDARVERWLEVAATVPAFVGFAVGRSTFWQPRDMWRITLTPVVLNAAAQVTFIIAGANKGR